ncbi:hypothetical protein M0802_010182 [Mischocyttarus mexicanus]|nr:hypothetical protein M0802_010182 [Mischocyttarus mexicanus]
MGTSSLSLFSFSSGFSKHELGPVARCEKYCFREHRGLYTSLPVTGYPSRSNIALLRNRDREKAATLATLPAAAEEEEGEREREREEGGEGGGGWSRLVPIASCTGENYRRVAWFSSTGRHRSQLLPASLPVNESCLIGVGSPRVRTSR